MPSGSHRIDADALLDSLLVGARHPRVTATITPRLATAMATTTRAQRSGITTSVRDASMPITLGSAGRAGDDEKSVQYGAIRPLRKCRSTPQLEALDALRTLTEPFSICGAAAALGWDYSEARHWIGELSARGYLVASRDGHRWSAEARTG